MSNFMMLPYNPDNFSMDLRYLLGEHIDDVKTFNSKRYLKNKSYIIDLVENTTMDFIRNSANIYRKGVNYIDWEEEEWIGRRASELTKLEKYKELNKQALLWTYLEDGEAYFKALHASHFVIIYDADGKIDTVIVRTGEFLRAVGGASEKWFHFSMWRGGKVYTCTAESWETLPSISNEASERNTQWKEDSNYTILPFTLIGKDIAKPQLSNIPAYENVISGGTAYGDIVNQRNFANMMFGQANMPEGKWKEVIDKMGTFEWANFPPATGDTQSQQPLNSLSLGDGKVQEQWTSTITKGLERMAHSIGANITGLYGEVKVETGASRRLQMENIIDVRNEKIVEFKEFERRDQKLLINLGVVSNASKVEYNDLDMGLTELDKETAEEKRQLNINNRYQNGIITKIQQIQETEKITIEDAVNRQREVLAERGEVIDGANSEIQEEE